MSLEGDDLTFNLPKDLHVLNRGFYSEIFYNTVKQAKQRNTDAWTQAYIEEYELLSKQLERSQLQDSILVRNVLLSRRLAEILVSDTGELLLANLPEQIQIFQNHLYSLGPDRQHDSARRLHILKVLCALRDDQEVVRLLRKIDKPHANKMADQIIRDTLQLPVTAAVTDAHAKRAVLSAWLCYLRQNVGSCFATAPAIFFIEEQPQVFLRDLDALLSVGRLQRIFDGTEYTAPLSVSWGAGDLRRPIELFLADTAAIGNLSLSPGLLNAFIDMGILDGEIAMKERVIALRSFLQQLFATWKSDSNEIQTSPEEIIRRSLLIHLQLTEFDLAEYQRRPRGMIQSSLLIQQPQSALGSGGKGEVCARFYVLFESACKAFKQLTENALLKSWEFTLASFAETKPTVSRWNFYVSLGLNPDDRGGIGPCIYQSVTDRLNEANHRVHELNEQYETIYGQVRYLEVRMRTASEQEQMWLRPELTSLVNEFRNIQQMRDTAQLKAQNISQLYQLLVDVYNDAFPRYFQEVYDADLHEVNVGLYDDSPAGFRLIYKYGRTNTSQWLPIYQANEFVEALASFFTATETEIISHESLQGLQDVLTRIISSILEHVRTPEFLESAFYRMAVYHNVQPIANPLEHLDRVEKKPWVYTSGGSMATLVSCYCNLEDRPTAVTSWVESPMELAVFLVDTVKHISQGLREFPSSLLMHSPTHAFLCKTDFKLFHEAILSPEFTYTWVRDTVVVPGQRFVSHIVLTEAKMQYLVMLLLEKVPINYRTRFQEVFKYLYGSMDPIQFRKHVIETMETTSGLSYFGMPVLSSDIIDSVLYENIPLISAVQLPESVAVLLGSSPDVDEKLRKALLDCLDKLIPNYSAHEIIGAKALQDIVKSLFILVLGTGHSFYDYHAHIALAAQSSGYAMPQPLIFADTNWCRDYFAFTVNPGNGLFELWRVDCNGSSGVPMSMWKQWVDGSQQEPRWGVYTKSSEYHVRV